MRVNGLLYFASGFACMDRVMCMHMNKFVQKHAIIAVLVIWLSCSRPQLTQTCLGNVFFCLFDIHVNNFYITIPSF